ncbi:aminoacyl tRNA synthase complex-interacting multifunctional protein 1-like [Neosynchiropus ocellatus]
MDADNLFNPSMAAALMKLDPEDGEKIMEYLKTHALLTREKALLQSSVREQKKLLVENAKLKKDIEDLRRQLQDKQRRRSTKAQHPAASSPSTTSSARSTPAKVTSSPAGAAPSVSLSSDACRDRQNRRRRGEQRARPASVSLEVDLPVDVSRLDLRVGRILSVRRHPLAETLLVQEVDVGESAPRTVVGKLGRKTDQDEATLEELQGSLAVLLCNVKACKLKGVVSQARLLCCCDSEDVVELLAPPTGSSPGDRVTCLDYPGEPDKELQSKQRVWELLRPDLKVDGKGVANFKGCGFQVKGKGLCRAPSLNNCNIR